MPRHTHTVTVSNVGGHTHNYSISRSDGDVGMLYGGSSTKGSAASSSAGSHNHPASADYAGGTNNTFSLIQPFLPVYMWQRSA